MLISDGNVVRGKWPMGCMEKLFPRRDGLVCTVVLKTQEGVLKRPVQRLHQLETSVESVPKAFSNTDPHGGECTRKEVKKQLKGKKKKRAVETLS